MNDPLITTVEGLPQPLAAFVSPEEKKYIEEIKRRGGLPFAVTQHFASLARPLKDDPIRRQFFPDPAEALPDSFGLDDPLGEHLYNAAPRLVHQYKDRALLLACGACFGYCRYCFRRMWLAGGLPFINTDDESAKLRPAELRSAILRPAILPPILAYLCSHPEINEILVSGGDPLTAGNDRLGKLFAALRRARPAILLRVCTRAPVTNPARLCEETIAMFRQYRPLRVVIHLNHPRELSVPCRERLAACAASGIPVLVQTVLLRGINDDPAVLAELIENCLDLKLIPYYLFQLDLAPGTRHFRVPLEQGLAVYRDLEKMFGRPGAAAGFGPGPDLDRKLPVYAVDLPGGGGKIRLHDGVIAGRRTTAAGQVYLLRDSNGKLWEYPEN
ncbi:MAG: radical SAM protein [Treponema sp.]|nr:radical SAM protein [Treponema sp.]